MDPTGLPRAASRRRIRRWWLVIAVPVLVVTALWGYLRWQGGRSLAAAAGLAPELDGGTAWINTDHPIHLKDLRGKVVVLDFWTLCCINCIQTIPDLARLEKKYADDLVVIGVHTAKFDHEKDTQSIRKAVLRYEIRHPVVNDAQMKIWDAYDVHSWPTLVLIDPEGHYLGEVHGEGNYDVLDQAIAKVIALHRKKGTLNETPLHFDLARSHESGDGALFFPGKVLADAAGNRLFISDSTHHRIVITDLEGKKLAIAGQGQPGSADGAFDRAAFNDPQGMALQGDTLYVADRKNHLIRALDLKAQTVKTVAGTGEQDRESRFRSGPALKVGLNSPWDLYLQGNTLYIAMAGHHQIWTLDLARGEVAPFAGSGDERILDGPLASAGFAQPSGLAGDGTTLYVADSEDSGIRSLPLDGKGEVKTLVGEGLFQFGDVDGVGDTVRLQHPLGVACHDGLVYVADTYNSKIKVLDPAKRSCTTLAGESAGWLSGPVFNEPGGLSFAGDKLYVADTGAHRIRVIDLKTRGLRTLALQGVEAPAKEAEAAPAAGSEPVPTTLSPALKKAIKKIEAKIEPAGAARGQTVTWKLTLELADGWHTYPTRQKNPEAEAFVNRFQFRPSEDVVFVGKLTENPSRTAILEGAQVFEDRVVWQRPLVIRPQAAPGVKTVKVRINGQICSKICLPLSLEVEAPLTVTDAPPVPVDARFKEEMDQREERK
jgi:DNA-binding beta-propeller fold protein YncE